MNIKEMGLRKYIERAKKESIKRHQEFGWFWETEELAWAIQEYEGSVGIENFTEDDWAAAKDNDFTMEEVLELCKLD